MTEYAHNHPPRCCCFLNPPTTDDHICPLCPEHGELAQLGNDNSPRTIRIYACCNQLVGRPHTDYCPTGRGGMWATQATQPTTVTSTPPTQVRMPDGSTRPATRDDHLDLLGVPRCTCPPAQIVGSGGDTIDQSDDPACPRHGEPTPLATPTPAGVCPSCGTDYQRTPTDCATPERHDHPR